MAADAPEVVEIEEELERLRSEPPSGSPTRRAVAAGLALLIALGGFALAASAFLGEPPVEGKDPPAPILGNGRIAIAQGPDQDVVLIDPDGSDPTTLVDRHGASLPYGLDMAWSPDGSMLAYTDVREDGLDGLFVLDLATGEVLDLSEGLADAAKPAWSPDGTRIAFTGLDRATGYDIYVVGSDGTGRVPITAEADNGVDGAHMPAWSPDGSRIAFAVDRYDEATETEDHGIVVVDASGGNEIRLTSSLDEQPVWSPDGSKLAFLRRTKDLMELYVVNADGSGERRISGEGIWTSLPSWSPDGSRLLFGTRDLETSNLGIVVVDVESGGSRSLLEDAYVASPVWSPDGGRIAFVRDDAGRPLPRVSLWMMRPDGTDLVELADALDGVSDVTWQPVPIGDPDPSPVPDGLARTNGSIYYRVGGEDGPSRIEAVEPDGSGRRVLDADPARISQIAWSPDGSRIAYRNPIASERGLYVANPDGTDAVRLTDGVNDGWPSWSPDGTQIAFSSTRHDPSVEPCTSSGDPDLVCPTDIYMIDSDGSDVTHLMTGPGPEWQPAWSPDGTRIAFTKTFETWIATAVYVMNVDGTDIRQISSSDGGSDSSPSWSPDGTQVVFTGFRYESTGIWIVAADGSNEHQIIGEDWYSVWDPVWSPDGTLIAFVGSPDGGEAALDKELYVMRPDGTGVTKLAEAPGSGVTGEVAWQPVLIEEETTPSPSPTTSPIEGSISAIDGFLPEGKLLVQVNDQVELLEEGAEMSTLIGRDLFGLDLSPDGSQALVSAPHESDTPLLAIDLSSGERTLIADLDAWTIPARWSPDGSSVAVRVGERNILCLRDLAIGEPRCMPELGRVFAFDWSPDGTRIVFEQGLPGSLTILDVETEQTSILVRWDDPAVLDAVAAAGLGEVVGIQFQGPMWSPSGRYVAGLGMVRTDDGHSGNVVLVFYMNGGVVARGVPFGEFSQARGWSPTADVFAYAAGEPPYQIVEVRLLDVSTGEDRLLFPTADAGKQTIHSLVWSPTGRWVAVILGTVLDRGYFVSEIQVLDTTGADPPRIFETSAFPELVDWGP